MYVLPTQSPTWQVLKGSRNISCKRRWNVTCCVQNSSDLNSFRSYIIFSQRKRWYPWLTLMASDGQLCCLHYTLAQKSKYDCKMTLCRRALAQAKNKVKLFQIAPRLAAEWSLASTKPTRAVSTKGVTNLISRRLSWLRWTVDAQNLNFGDCGSYF